MQGAAVCESPSAESMRVTMRESWLVSKRPRSSTPVLGFRVQVREHDLQREVILKLLRHPVEVAQAINALRRRADIGPLLESAILHVDGDVGSVGSMTARVRDANVAPGIKVAEMVVVENVEDDELRRRAFLFLEHPQVRLIDRPTPTRSCGPAPADARRELPATSPVADLMALSEAVAVGVDVAGPVLVVNRDRSSRSP